jgi:hypothetical protein
MLANLLRQSLVDRRLKILAAGAMRLPLHWSGARFVRWVEAAYRGIPNAGIISPG